jgi:hypothetical protein
MNTIKNIFIGLYDGLILMRKYKAEKLKRLS